MPHRLPGWATTVRIRLAVTYSALVFGIAAVVLVLVYLAVASSVDAKPLSDAGQEKFYVSESGTVKFLDKTGTEGELVNAGDLDLVQQAVNAGTLDRLRDYSFGALGALFVFSLLVGWWVAGRILRPLGAITSTARDITATDLSRRIAATGPRDELHELADTIDRMLDRLEEAFATQRALVNDVSHELRNPVAVITANVDAVLSDPDARAEDRARAVSVVSSATSSMTVLIEDLLAAARQRSGAFKEREVDLGDLAARAVDEYGVLIEERGLGLHTRLDAGPTVYADEQALVRALRNLISNAIRFSPRDGTLTVSVGSLRGWAWAAVGDQGPGIAEADRARVFDRFFSTDHDANAEASTSRNGNGGHGIGLAIARQIVEAHDGRLVVFSQTGHGSTFVVWLPDRTFAAKGERDVAPPLDSPTASWVTG